MTSPRQVLPGTTYLVTRRCSQRQFLLRPSKESDRVFAYVLASAARRYGVKIHAYCVLSNHFHLVVTDPHARLPAFQQYLGALVARAVNVLLGRWENLWSPSSYSAVALGTPQDVVEKAAYTLANPVAAGLVRRGREWPGLWSAPAAIGGSLRVHRPPRFFSKLGQMAETETLELTVPPGFESPEAFRRALEIALDERERAASRVVRRFLGPEGVLAQWPFSRPGPKEPRRRLRPRVASIDKWKRLEMLTRLKSFLSAYCEAFEDWARGMRNVVFPAGTYLMRVVHRAACGGPGCAHPHPQPG